MSDEKKEDVEFFDVQSGDAKKLEMSLSFRMDWRNPETGEVLSGVFTAQRPNLRMLGEIAILKAQLCAGQSIDANVDFLNEMMAFCQVVLTKKPDWWKPEEFYDATPLRKVWDRVRGWQLSFRERAVGQRPGAPQDDGQAAPQRAVAGEVVVPEVRKTA